MAVWTKSSGLPEFVKNKMLIVHRWIMDWEVVTGLGIGDEDFQSLFVGKW